jgi:membrane-bound serine protease (ClpP class)
MLSSLSLRISSGNSQALPTVSAIIAFFLSIFLLSLLSFPLAFGDTPISNETRPSPVYVIEIDAAIGPASFDHLKTSMRKAQRAGAGLIVVKLDTPGGLVSSMREMTKEILSSNTPVAVYVSPSGSYAASAGAFIVYSAHVASMAPGTNIGAASPIPLGSDAPLPNTPAGEDNAAPGKDVPAPIASTAQKKAIEDLTAYMRSMAEMNQRNAKLGVEMITLGSSFSAREALEKNIINFVSNDLDQLLQQLDGYQVNIKGETVTLNTKGQSITTVKPSWRYDFLSIITDPNVTYILLIAGIYGILFELYSPGALFPGILGFICIILAGYGLHLLPINYAGLFLVILGIIFIAAETFVTSYGLLGLGGLIAFVIGSVFLLDTLYPVYSVSKVIIGVMAILTGTILSIITNFVFGSLRAPQMTGGSELIGKRARVVVAFDDVGQVTCDGSVYSAETKIPLRSGQHVIVKKTRGIRLFVEPIDS